MIKRADAHELVIEIGMEEMPSPLIPTALSDLKENAAKQFLAASLSHGHLHSYASPRRLILHVPQLADRQADRTDLILGPPAKISFDLNGNPTAAATGFAKSIGVPVSKLIVSKTEKGEYLAIQKKTVAQRTSTLLKTIIPEIIASLHFKKTMRWNGTVSFIRPIRWLAAVYNHRTVPFDFAQIQSGNLSYGHRLLQPAPFKVTDFTSYKKECRSRFVIIDPDERHKMITKQINALAMKVSGKIEADDPLIWQAVHSTEYPTAICGEFDRQFLSMPAEIIATAMKEHQGYFPLTHPNGEAQPRFIAILNNKDKGKTIQKGNERVLRARLADAKFFFDEDKKTPLKDRLDTLKNVQFHEGLGTLYDKTQRLIKLSQSIARRVHPPLSEEALKALEMAATVCKCDLTTGVVREFPSLQGVMGRILAAPLGVAAAPVGVAIEEHYQPRYPGDKLPKSDLGSILSVADKLDTIVGCFLIGKIPSGSEDPYALRRQGLGMIQVMSMTPLFRSSENESPMRMDQIIREAIALYKLGKDVENDLDAFLRQRIAFYLQSDNIRCDFIDAVLERSYVVYDIVERARALDRFSKNKLFNPLITSYKRAARILPNDPPDGGINDDLLTNEAKALKGAVEDVRERLSECCRQRKFDKALKLLATLYHPLDQFFGKVLVMDPNAEVRRNHLWLLWNVKGLFRHIGDFSKIQEGGGTHG